MPELRRCSCCGGIGIKDEIPVHTHKIATFMPDCAGRTMIECNTCQHMVIGATLEEATTEWNLRPPARKLTLAELRGMAGKPYWHRSLAGNGDKWFILPAHVAANPQDYHYGEDWVAYDREPEVDK